MRWIYEDETSRSSQWLWDPASNRRGKVTRGGARSAPPCRVCAGMCLRWVCGARERVRSGVELVT